MNLLDYRKNWLLVAASVAYIVAFLTLYPIVESGIVSGLIIFPTVLVGWHYGKRAGIASAFGFILVDMVLFHIVHLDPLQQTIFGPGAIGNMLVIVMGVAAGWIGQMNHTLQHQTALLDLERKRLNQEIEIRKAVECELRESEARIRTVIGAIPDLIFTMDHQGLILDYHARDASHLPLPVNQSFEGYIYDLFPRPYADRCRHDIGVAIATQALQRFECSLLYQGVERQYEVRFVPLTEIRLVTVIRDVTERDQVVRQKLLLEFEKERVHHLTQLITSVSHDFRTPLAVVRTASYLIRHLQDEEKRSEQLSSIDEQVDIIESYIKRIMLMARLDSTQELMLTPISMNNLISVLQEPLTQEAQKYQQQILFELQPELPTIMGDTELLTIVIENLIQNAMQYTFEGGTITIQTKQIDKQVVLSIQDTGIGIDPEKIPLVFDRFYRGDTARNQIVPGTGLGLTIAKSAIDLHGGKLGLSSRTGLGTRCEIHLPVPELEPEKVFSD